LIIISLMIEDEDERQKTGCPHEDREHPHLMYTQKGKTSGIIMNNNNNNNNKMIPRRRG